MPNVRIGWAGELLKETMRSPKINKTASGPEVEEIFNCNYADAEAGIAARGLTYGDSCPIEDNIYSDALLSLISINKAGPKNAMVIYKWTIPDTSSPDNQPVGTLTLDTDSNTIEIPIGQHPAASSTNYDIEKKIGIGEWEGIESYLSPQPVFNRSEIVDDFTFSEANIISNVAKWFTQAQMTPKGLTDATDEKWLKMSLAVSTAGSNFQKVERWQYAENGWQTDIYGAAV